MRSILLSALVAAGVALAGVTGAAAAPVSPTLDGVAPAPLYTPAQVIIVGPRPAYRPHRRQYCYNQRRCYYTRHHRRFCEVRRVCRWR